MGAKYVFNPLTGNLDTTDVVAFNGEVNLGTAAAPSVFFTGDSNTGIYSPGADQLAISTNGAGRLFIDSSGNLGLGTSSPQELLHLSDGSGTNTDINSVNNLIEISDLNSRYDGTSTTAGNFTSGIKFDAYQANGSRRFGSFIYQVVNSNNFAGGGVQMRTSLVFGTRGDDVDANGSPLERLRIDSSGNVGIGTTGPADKLSVAGSSATDFRALTLRNSDGTTGSAAVLTFEASAGTEGSASAIASQIKGIRDGLGTSGGLEFWTSNAGTPYQRARIDSSGRLLVGTSTARSNISTTLVPRFQVEGTGASDSRISLIRNSNSLAAPAIALGKTRGASVGSNAIVLDDDFLGGLEFYGADGTNFITGASIYAAVDGTPGADDMPGRLVFSVTADGSASPTEALRITNDRYVRLASGTGGIQFNGDTAAANALDDYEEGTWTPVIVGGTTAGTGTYSTQVGRYTKVGRQIHCAGTLIWTAHDGTGNMRIEGLPFAALNISDLFNAAVFAYVANITMPADSILMGDLANNTSRMNLRSVVTGGGTPSTLAMDSTGNIYFSITYQTN